MNKEKVEADVRNILSENGAGIVDMVTGEVKISESPDVIRRMIPETFVNWKKFHPEEGEVILIAKDPEVEQKLRNKWKRLEERGLCQECEGDRTTLQGHGEVVGGWKGPFHRSCPSCRGTGIEVKK